MERLATLTFDAPALLSSSAIILAIGLPNAANGLVAGATSVVAAEGVGESTKGATVGFAPKVKGAEGGKTAGVVVPKKLGTLAPAVDGKGETGEIDAGAAGGGWEKKFDAAGFTIGAGGAEGAENEKAGIVEAAAGVGAGAITFGSSFANEFVVFVSTTGAVSFLFDANPTAVLLVSSTTSSKLNPAGKTIGGSLIFPNSLSSTGGKSSSRAEKTLDEVT